MYILLFLFVIRGYFFGLIHATPTYSKITYFSFSSANIPEPSDIANVQVLSLVSRADDNPLEQVSLPWSFPLLGVNIKSVWVSPNGALMFSKLPPAVNIVTGDYYGSINAYTTDLNPGQSMYSNITAYEYGDHVTISFKRVPVFSLTLTASDPKFIYHGINENNFRISLYSDGHVSIHYDNIIPISNLAYAGSGFFLALPFFTGLRDFSGSVVTSNCNYTTAQLAIGRSAWGTTTPGIYPRLADVATGTQFTMCSVSSVWALSPASFDSSPGSSASALLTLTPLALSCAANVTYAIYLDGYSASPASCVYSSSGAVPTLTCDAIGFRSQGLAAGDYAVKVQWTSVVASTPQSGTLNIPALTLSVSGGAAGTGCGLNTDIPGCDACTVAGGGLGCLQLPCGSVYPSSSCAGDCSFTKSADFNGVCCENTAMDCAGICSNPPIIPAAIGYNISNDYKVYETTCCTNADCHGVCGGTAVLDACLVCGGNSTSYTQCPLKVAVNTHDPSGGTDLFPIFQSFQYSQIIPVEIDNLDGFYTVKVVPVIQGNSALGPTISLPTSFVVAPSGVGSLSVNISYASLFNGAQKSWESKVIKLDIIAVDGSTTVFNGTSRTISIYPTFSNCSEIKDRDACMRLPACIYCLRYPDIRLLREVGDENDLQTHRHLYVDLVPPSSGYGIKVHSDSAYGQCTNGWDTEADCVATILSLYSSASTQFVSGVRYYYLVVVVAFLAVLIINR